MTQVEYLNTGLINNWELAILKLKHVTAKPFAFSGDYFFVYDTDDLDEAWFIHGQYNLDEFITKMFWECEQYRYIDSGDYMEDWRIWRFISGDRVKKFPSAWPNAKPTRFKDNEGVTIYRTPVLVWAEKTINVGTTDK